jgi:serine protease inhibitor
MSLEVANRIYIKASFSVLKDFRRTVRKTFGSDMVEMKNPEEARTIINNWVAKITRHKIKEIIGPGNNVSYNNDYAVISVCPLNNLIDQFCDASSLHHNTT